VKSEFLTAPALKQIGPNLWELIADLEYRSRILSYVCIRKGFTTDKASVPRLPFVYWTVGARGDGPAVIHDFLYQGKCHRGVKVSRRTADAVFYEALGAEMPWGYPAEPGWAQTLMWLGVRVGGWWAWQGHRRAKKLNPEMTRNESP
jgi:hypothetical protein